jgi:hypothetical protein
VLTNLMSMSTLMSILLALLFGTFLEIDNVAAAGM